MKGDDLSQGLPGRIALWDIDGTLIDVLGPTRDKHTQAVMDVVGLAPASTRSTSGMTDLQIINALARSVGHELSTSSRLEILSRLAELTEEHLAEAGVEELPGVRKALEMFNRRGWANCLLTGNTRRRAQLKLSSINLWTLFEFGFFGDDALDRRQLVSRCARQLRVAGARGVVVGDTPLDIEAAQGAGLPVIAVSTGHFGLDELVSLKPDVAVLDLCSGIRELSNFVDAQEVLAEA